MVLIKVRINQRNHETEVEHKWNKIGTRSFKYLILYLIQGQPMLGSHPNPDNILKLPSWLCSWWGWGQVIEGWTCSFQQKVKLDLLLFSLYLKQKWLAVYFSCLFGSLIGRRMRGRDGTDFNTFVYWKKVNNFKEQWYYRGQWAWIFILPSCRYTSYLVRKLQKL